MRLETNLNHVLKHAQDLPWDHHLFAPCSKPLTGDLKVIVLNDDEEQERTTEGEPEYSAAQGMGSLLGISALQDVVENLCQQVQNPSSGQLLEALAYYIENDAFIHIGAGR